MPMSLLLSLFRQILGKYHWLEYTHTMYPQHAYCNYADQFYWTNSGLHWNQCGHIIAWAHMSQKCSDPMSEESWINSYYCRGCSMLYSWRIPYVQKYLCGSLACWVKLKTLIILLIFRPLGSAFFQKISCPVADYIFSCSRDVFSKLWENTVCSN